MTISSALIGAGVFLVFNPRLLYGFYWSGSIKEKIEIKEITPVKSISQTQTEELEELCGQVTNLVQTQKLFLKQGITINDLSKELNIPVYKISQAINLCYDTNFNQWINQFRIEEFDRLIRQGEHERLTLDGIASKCGFSNRTTFISCFKKIKGNTPSQYLKSISQLSHN
jgi:YesN/AraC family two-component response regulator